MILSVLRTGRGIESTSIKGLLRWSVRDEEWLEAIWRGLGAEEAVRRGVWS